VKFVKVVGVVVAVDEFEGRKVYTIDDSSGACLECSCVVPIVKTAEGMEGKKDLPDREKLVPEDGLRTAKTEAKSIVKEATKSSASSDQGVSNPNVPWGLIDVGMVIKVKGRVGWYWNAVQVEVVSAFLVKGTDFEVKFWNEARAFKREVLDKEWVLSLETTEKLKKKAERRLKKSYQEGRKDALRVLDESSTNESRANEDRDAARKLLEKQMRARARKEEAKRKKCEEGEESRRQAAQLDEQRRKRRRDLEDARNRIRYPSLAVRKAAAGKYDLLGI
jgi:endo-1,3(4)-beta-glucanase